RTTTSPSRSPRVSSSRASRPSSGARGPTRSPSACTWPAWGGTAAAGGGAPAGGRRVRAGGRAVELTGIEFDLLLALMRRAGRVVPRDALLSLAGRDDVVVGERTVDVHISHLRAKLGDDPRTPAVIKTVRGVGYVLVKE